MRLRPELVLAAVVAIVPLAGVAQPDVSAAADEMPTRVEIRDALDKVANDPNLAAERTVNMLRWKEPEPVTDEPTWWQWVNALARWFRGLFDWMAESARLLVWVLGGLAVVLLAIYIARLVSARGMPRIPKQFVAPSHVRDLDIRPESLPDDVGAAALALWQRGEQRAALALCTAARSRASCMCTPCRSARRPRRASASRSLVRGSPSRACATCRASSRPGARPSMALAARGRRRRRSVR